MMRYSEIRFQRIFESGRYFGLLQFSDGKLYTEDGCSFDVHKVTLGSRSDFFRAMFCGIDKSKNEFTISNISGECLSVILSYIYTDDICVSSTNLKDLLIAADYLLLKDLYLKLKQEVKNNITHANCLKLYLAAYELNEKEMSELCFKFIYVRFEEIIRYQKDDLVDLPLEVLKTILSNRNLNVESERTVWKAITYCIQACAESRLNCVQNLLSTLSIMEIDESLATEIINHDIVHKNPHMKSLIDMKSFHDFKSDCDLLISFLVKLSNDSDRKIFRVPEKLNIISKVSSEGRRSAEIFISYDETPCLWRKITDVNFAPEYLITAGSNLFVSNLSTCVKFSLRTMEPEIMTNFRRFSWAVLAIENCMYNLYRNENGVYGFQVYNADDNTWLYIPCYFNNVRYASAIAIGKNILVVVVKSEPDGMIVQLLNSANQQWISLSPPKIHRFFFELKLYNGKIYLFGGHNAANATLNVEVYDPELDFWKEIRCLPFDNVSAIILNDQMIFYDYDEDIVSKAVRWNDIEECCESLENSILPEKLFEYEICTVSDAETIKFQTKINRNSKTKMEKSAFNRV